MTEKKYSKKHFTCPREESEVGEVDDDPEELTHGLGHRLVQPGEDEEGQLRHQQAPVTVILRDAARGGPVVNLQKNSAILSDKTIIAL